MDSTTLSISCLIFMLVLISSMAPASTHVLMETCLQLIQSVLRSCQGKTKMKISAADGLITSVDNLEGRCLGNGLPLPSQEIVSKL